MKDQKVIRNPGAFQLLADDTRLKMIYLLRAKEMTVSQIAEEVGLTPQTIYHHIKKLKEADMVEVAKEERIDHLVESYYRATAGVFHFVDGTCDREGDSETRITRTIEAIAKLGHELDLGKSSVAKVARLRDEIQSFRESPRVVEKVYDMDDLDPFIQKDVVELAMMIETGDAEFEKYIDAQRTLRELLRAPNPDA